MCVEMPIQAELVLLIIVTSQSLWEWDSLVVCSAELGMLCEPQSPSTLVSDFQASCCGLLSLAVCFSRERFFRVDFNDISRPTPRRFSRLCMFFVKAGQERRNLPVVGNVRLVAAGALCRD